MGNSVGDRLREVADRLDELGQDLKEGAKAALDKAIATLESIADRAERGEDIAPSEGEGVLAQPEDVGQEGA